MSGGVWILWLDTVLDGRRFRALTVVDNWSRHSQLIEPDFTLTGTKVVAALERVAKRTGYPADDHRGQWERIYFQGARRLGPRAWREARFHFGLGNPWRMR